ncbi:NAD(P)/FAD-dependent oxidoreductase [Botrimarina sp.]|uniref:NAD(P)/FAD-dependent oxidoreductase n=1 Tax=Botrimarina sp. TaxID=2795802 RepID=UPI0032EBDCB7
MSRRPHVLIVGGGFGGFAAAKRLRNADVSVTLVDRTNHHLFQPLLYQVATGGLSPANIAAPLRNLLRSQKNVTVLQDEITGVDPTSSLAWSNSEHYAYDYAIFAAGGVSSYFGKPEWAAIAPGLKTLTDAREIRRRVLGALEVAELQGLSDPPTFVVVGGGPTGVETAGAIAELTRHTLVGEFRRTDPSKSRILLVEAADRLLTSYPESLSAAAAERLAEMGVELRLGSMVSELQNGEATLTSNGRSEKIATASIVWAAGIAGSPLAGELAKAAGIAPERDQRVAINADLTLTGYDNVFAIGDMVRFAGRDGAALPGVAPVAIQQGKHAAYNVLRSLRGKQRKPFQYRNYGAMSVIGRGAAVADIGPAKLTGYPAWFAWLFVHLLQLVGHQNRALVAMQWGWNYFTKNRSARLTSGDAMLFPAGSTEASEPHASMIAP